MQKTITMRKLLLFLCLNILCDCAEGRVFDSSDPDVHDPVMAQGEDGRYYIFSTGMGIDVMSSDDLKHWRHENHVFQDIPRWAMDTVKGYHGHTWAPDISYHKGLWHLYYSCSTFGKNGSAIGLAVNKSLDPASPDYGWEDRGMVIASHQGREHWNAIDPNLTVDDEGQPYLSFGSFWDGIKLVKLSADDFRTPVGEVSTIARRIPSDQNGENPVEAPFIFRHGDYYYLLVSFDYCCKGEKSTYKTVYGRSKNIEGPYYDRDGKAMTEGGGTLLFGPDKDNYGIGHCAVYTLADGRIIFVSHAYRKAARGRAKLFVRELEFDSRGWIK